jgi:hypothetical protein
MARAEPSPVPLSQITEVRLVKETYPAVVAFRARLAERTAERQAEKKRERAAERARLETILGRPIAVILEHERELREAVAHAMDRWRIGEPYPVGGELWRRLAALENRLRPHGIQYSASRWEAHRCDLDGTSRPAEGFELGRNWERAVRAWIDFHHGPAFFLPQRWLVASSADGRRWFREVDGIEKRGPAEAIVYEIRHRHHGAPDGLQTVYVPLLKRAFPHVTFASLEINPINLYVRSREGRDYLRLRSLDDRAVVSLHQLWTPRGSEIPSQDRATFAQQPP